MELITTTLGNIDIEDLEFLGDFYGVANRGILIKLALRKFVNEHFAKDVSEDGEDQDLEGILAEEK